MHLDLPTPDADAQAISTQLQAMLAAIIAEQGPLPFHDYMQRCLYTPGLGYYSAGSHKFGEAGDFVTAPELGSIFAACVAEHMVPVISALGSDSAIFELGGGSGAFARDCLLHLAQKDRLPRHYYLLEPSADLRERQQRCLAQDLPQHIYARVSWLDQPLQKPWRGILFANEVIDALPATRFVKKQGRVYAEHVDVDDKGTLQIVDQAADSMLQQAVEHVEQDLEYHLPDAYRSEILPQLPYWLDAVTASMQQGLALFVDYGYPRGAYYLPERADGTLRAYYRQRAHADVLWWPGLQDITASVDFTALAEAGEHAGFTLGAYNTQMQFLLAGNLQDVYDSRQNADTDAEAQYKLAQEIKQLTLPGMMGESFQAMLLLRDLDVDTLLPGLAGNSWLSRL